MDPGPTTSREQDGFALSHPLWFYGVLAGLVLLPVEWWLYQRRWIG